MMTMRRFYPILRAGTAPITKNGKHGLAYHGRQKNRIKGETPIAKNGTSCR